jgi:sulfur-carrier protein adenylyltransferase/sulfurtransferase
VTTTSDIDPGDVDLSAFAVVLDIRPAPVSAASVFPGAVHCSVPDVLGDPASYIPDSDTPVLVVCDIGVRSSLAARQLLDAGFLGVRSLRGGVEAWRRSGRGLERGVMAPEDVVRYDRQVRLPEIGVDGQLALRSATVTVVGAGGLGIPVIGYLAGAGVGKIRIVDDDHIELANLHRQPIYTVDDIGTSKVAAVARFVEGLNPDVLIDPRDQALDEDNAVELLTGSDVIVDATDRFDARYAISDASHRLGIPVVSGAVYRWEGQLTVLPPEGPCYRCVFPRVSTSADLDCSITGVAGPVVGTVGAMQATETIKVITTSGTPLVGRLLLYDGLGARTTTLRLTRRPDCPTCGDQMANAGSPSGRP